MYGDIITREHVRQAFLLLFWWAIIEMNALTERHNIYYYTALNSFQNGSALATTVLIDK